MLHAVIMAGGSGTRFWPASRKQRPKQFLPVAGTETLLRQTVDRCLASVPVERIWVVTGAHLLEEAQRQIPDVHPSQILVEPRSRNTAACLGVAALRLVDRDPDATMLAVPADHFIRPTPLFSQCVQSGLDFLQDRTRACLLFGVSPTRPATGYGYIERGEDFRAGSGIVEVRSFYEKPDCDKAQSFLDSGRYLWNCGILMGRAAHLLDLLHQYQPEIGARLDELQRALATNRWNETLELIFPAMPSISIDCGVLEHASGMFCLVLPKDLYWDDVGSWHSIERLRGADAAGNATVGPFVSVETRNCIVHTTPDHLVAAIGLEDCIIVHTPDATLVARRSDDNAMRLLIAQLEAQGYGEFL